MESNFVGERITALLMERNMSERHLSLALGRSDSYINKITRGRMNLSVEELFYICDYLQITPGEFFSDHEFRTLSQDEAALCHDLRTLPKEDVVFIKTVVEYIKKKNKK